MSEFKFKFKKPDAKKIGDFDPLDKDEWALLIKPQIQDVTLFLHFHKMWNTVETPEVVDSDGNVTQKEIKKQPAWKYSTGFIKDEKFIVTQQKVIHRQTFHEIYKAYSQVLEQYIEQGYTKDWNNYVNGVPKEPEYYINENTSQKEHNIAQILRSQGNISPAVMPQQSQQPVQQQQQQGRPHIQIKPLRMKIAATSANSSQQNQP